MKIQAALVLGLLISASSALAHVEPGTYVGKTADGAECSMIAGETFFLGGVKHPLNERINLQVAADSFTVGHPSIVNVAESISSFDHDFFQGVLPTSVGSKALVVKMNHEEGNEGPTSYVLIDHAWKTDVRSKLECLSLKLQ